VRSVVDIGVCDFESKYGIRNGILVFFMRIVDLNVFEFKIDEIKKIDSKQ
jgi:hypothetical protein